MHIYVDWRDGESLALVGYDPMADSEFEFCVVFESLEEENTVRAVTRHRRKHKIPEQCELIENLSKEDLARFDKEMPRFYDLAMKTFRFVPFDDRLPEIQEEFPFQNGPQK